MCDRGGRRCSTVNNPVFSCGHVAGFVLSPGGALIDKPDKLGIGGAGDGGRSRNVEYMWCG